MSWRSVYAENTAYVIDRHDADAYASGLGDIWGHVLDMEESPSRTMLLGIVGALATCLRETGYSPPPQSVSGRLPPVGR